jgi:hypothetical protein
MLIKAHGWLSPQQKPGLGSEIDWGHPLSRDLVVRWLLNEGAGSAAVDLVRRTRGLLNNGTRWRQGLWMDGTTQYFRSDVLAHNIGTGDFTWSARLQLDTYSIGKVSGPTIMTNGDYAPWFGVDTNQAGNNKSLCVYWAAYYRFNTPLSLTRRYHTVLVRRNGVMTAYLDAVAEPTTWLRATSMVNSYTLLGVSGLGLGDGLAGSIDDVSIIRRALSPDEVRWLSQEPYAMIRAVGPPRRYFTVTGLDQVHNLRELGPRVEMTEIGPRITTRELGPRVNLTELGPRVVMKELPARVTMSEER